MLGDLRPDPPPVLEASLEILSSVPGRLNHAVERHELRDDQLSHDYRGQRLRRSRSMSMALAIRRSRVSAAFADSIGSTYHCC